MKEAGEPQFDWADWAAVTVRLMNPTKVAIIEALLFLNQPLSPTDLTRLFHDENYELSKVSYHTKQLAKAGVLTVTRTHYPQGCVQRFYAFHDDLLNRS